MGDDIKEAPNSFISDATDVMSKALENEIKEDEPKLDTSKKEEPSAKQDEEKPAEKKEEPEIDIESLKTEHSDLLKLKGRLGEELGLERKRADYYQKLAESIQSTKPEEKKLAEDKFAKLADITDPIEYAKNIVTLSEERAQAIINQRDAEFAYKTQVWNDLTVKYPELKDTNSEMYKQTDALMKARKIDIGNAEMAAELVKSQLKLAEFEKEKGKIADEIKIKKIEKSKQGGLKQPSSKSKDSPAWDNMPESERVIASKLGLDSKSFEEVV